MLSPTMLHMPQFISKSLMCQTANTFQWNLTPSRVVGQVGGRGNPAVFKIKLNTCNAQCDLRKGVYPVTHSNPIHIRVGACTRIKDKRFFECFPMRLCGSCGGVRT